MDAKGTNGPGEANDPVGSALAEPDQQPSSRWKAYLVGKIPAALLFVMLAVVAGVGLRGLELPYHWDENTMIKTVAKSCETGEFLPRRYYYGSVTFLLALAPAIPEMVSSFAGQWAAKGKKLRKISKARKKHVLNVEYKHKIRAVFFLVSIFSALGLYRFVSELSKNRWIGLLGAMALLSSWEVNYHARRLAPDCILMCFCSWAIYAQYRLLSVKREADALRWVVASSVLAGLCIGVKYTGGVMLLPLLLAVTLAKTEAPAWRRTLRLGPLALVITATAFLLSTPGAILDLSRFLQHLHFESAHYQRGHSGYSIEKGGPHLRSIALYLLTVAFSKNTAIAIATSALAFLGGLFLVKTQRRVALWLVAFPVVYVAFVANQGVMFVRNLLQLFPVIAALMAVGVFAILQRVGRQRLRQSLVLVPAFVLMGCNLAITTRAAAGIASPLQTTKLDALQDYLQSPAGSSSYLSPGVRAILAQAGVSGEHGAKSLKTADRFVFESREARKKFYVANVPGRYRTIWSRYEEVNWDYYPSWSHKNRLLEVSVSDPALKRLIQHAVNPKKKKSKKKKSKKKKSKKKKSKKKKKAD